MLRALIVMLVLLVPTFGRADDRCLDGDSALADQRALAALRTATDGACPCTVASGGHARADYLRCARQQLRNGLDASQLRRPCARNARALVRGSTCGGSRVACGGVDAMQVVSCRDASPSGGSACGTSSRRSETACPQQTFCDDVVTWTAGTCLDPRSAGPYGVGVRLMHLVKDSVVTPGTDRVLDTAVWYPIAPTSDPVDPTYQGVMNAPALLDGAPYPLLMFSHGSCGYPAQSTFLMTEIASHGYVIAAPPHPGNTINEFPTCGTGPAQAASAQERPADIRFALDQMLAANQDSSSPFFGTIDPDRIGMSGHSFGGFTTYVAQGQDSRFKVAIAMAPAAGPSFKLTVPSLTMFGTIDSVVNLPNIRAAYANSSAPKIEVELEHTGHYAFSNGCFPAPECNPPVTLTQDEAHVLVERYVLPFLQRYLVGDASAESFFHVAPPGVVVSQDR